MQTFFIFGSMTVGFDYDQTLTEYKMQQLAKKFILAKCDVWIITSRREGDHNKDLFNILKKIGLPPQKVIFTDGESKVQFVAAINADLFFDNDQYECDIINSFTGFCAVRYNQIK